MSLSSDSLYRLIRSILCTNRGLVCKHSVCLDILNEMEKNGETVTDDFKKLVEHIANADDENALNMLEQKV